MLSTKFVFTLWEYHPPVSGSRWEDEKALDALDAFRRDLFLTKPVISIYE